MDFSVEIKGHTLEYLDDVHQYIVDGIEVPSITQLLKVRFANKYEGVGAGVLRRAAEKGTATHEAIEAYCQAGIEDDSPELHNFKFLMRVYGMTPIQNEVPVILFDDDEPIAAGRLDLVLENLEGNLGGADIKRTAVLDKEYLVYQLNLYRRAYRQSYDEDWTFLRGIHLREDKRKMVEIPLNEDLCDEIITEWRNKK